MSQTLPPNGAPSLAERVQALKLPPGIRVPPRRGSRWTPWWIGFLVVAVIAAAAWFGRNAWRPLDPAASAAATAPISVPAEKNLTFGGYIIPAQKVQISPKVGGQVVSLYKNLEEGTFVPKGTVLATLETTEYDFDLRRAQAIADLAKAKHDELANGSREEEKRQAAAAMKEAEEQLEEGRDALTRIRESGRAATPDEIFRAETKFRTWQFKVEQLRQSLKMMVDGPREEKKRAAKAELDQAFAERDKAQWRLDNTKVISPIDGVILEKKAEVGNTVRPEAFSNGLSASLCDMADLTNLEVDVDISERDIHAIRQGQKCKVTTEALRDKVYEGVVSRIMPVASRSKASVAVRVKLQVPPGETQLRPEMRARVEFIVEGAAAIPMPSAPRS